jgi:hypothetical protein
MAFCNTIKKVMNRFSGMCRVFDVDGSLLGEEHIQVSPVQRSVDENIAAFGRTGMFSFNTVVSSGCIIKTLSDDEEYFISSWRGISLKGSITAYSAFLIQVNAVGDVYRQEEKDFNPDTGEVSYGFIKKIENLKLYITKKDWTMESITPYGRDQKGYETIVCQERDVQKGDRISCEGKIYIVQDIDTTLRDRMLRLQVGLNIKHIEG